MNLQSLFLCFLLILANNLKCFTLLKLKLFSQNHNIVFSYSQIVLYSLVYPLTEEISCLMSLVFFEFYFNGWSRILNCLWFMSGHVNRKESVISNCTQMIMLFLFRMTLDGLDSLWEKIIIHWLYNFCTLVMLNYLNKPNNELSECEIQVCEKVKVRKRSYSLSDCMQKYDRLFHFHENYFFKGFDKKVPTDETIEITKNKTR